MDTPPSGMPSPPLSPHGTPSSLASDFPSLSGSLYSVIAPDSPCDESSDYERRYRAPIGFSSTEHPESINHLILPTLTLGDHISRTTSVSAFGDHVSLVASAPPRSEIHYTEESLGNLRLLVLGRHGAGKTFLSESLVRGMAQVVEVQRWKHDDRVGRILSASSGDKDSTNLTIIRVDGWDESDEPQAVLDSIMHVVQAPFRELDQLLNPAVTLASSETSDLSVALLSSAATPLYTAAIVILSSTPTPIENQIIRVLSQHLPTVPFASHRPRRRHSPDYSRPHSRPRASRPHSRHYSRNGSPPRPLHSRAPSIPTIEDEGALTVTALPGPSTAAFQPTSHRALRDWIFDAQRLQKLRREGVEKFFQWRERERQIQTFTSTMHSGKGSDMTTLSPVAAGPARLTAMDAFERFTFDQLFNESDFGDTDEPPEESDVPSYTESTAQSHLPPAEVPPRDPMWEAELSRAVALRKRQDTTRVDTIRATVPSVRLPLAAVMPPPDTLDTEAASESSLPSFETAESIYKFSPFTVSGAATPSGYAAIDPLHLPTLVSLAWSIVPDIRTRVCARIRAFFASPFKLPSHASDVEPLSEKSLEEDEPASVSVPLAGVLCAAAAAIGFWAGVAVGGKGGVSPFFAKVSW